MGKSERYEPRTFCRVDLVTTDSAGAKTFYDELFGWEAEDMPAGESATYTMLPLSGDYVCALYEIGAEGHEQGTSPQWFSYVSVEDSDATATRARAGRRGRGRAARSRSRPDRNRKRPPGRSVRPLRGRDRRLRKIMVALCSETGRGDGI